MSDRYAAQALAALRAVQPRPPDAFLWFGRRVPADASGGLAEAIAGRLRDGFLPTGEPRPEPAAPPVAGAADGAFARALSQANSGRGAWHEGWRVAGADEHALRVVRPDGLVLLAAPQDCRIDGARAAVRVPKELGGLVPGVLRALGDSPPRADGEPLVRLCWDVAAAGAVTLVARVTYALNGAGIPFALDLPTDPARLAQRPAAGLLLARRDFAPATRLLRPLLRALARHLSGRAPAFAKPLAPGLSVAEEPGDVGDGSTAGARRCALLADAIVAAAERGARADDERLDVVRERFAAAGIDLAAPYLEPGSDDAYDLP